MDRREWLKRTGGAGALAYLMPGELFGKEKLKSKSVDDFGPDFVWGVATAAHQIEGAVDADGKSNSIWNHFETRRRKIDRNESARTACDFYHRYPADLDILRSMAFRNFRFSIAWSRILPEGTGKVNLKGIDFYNRLIDACLERGIQPWICLYHWDLPQCLEERGGWTNRDITGWFEEYARVCARAFGDRVKDWMVLNEPLGFTSFGYMTGLHAPGRMGAGNFIPAVHHAALCQAIGGRVLRLEVPDGNIGTTFSCSKIYPKNDSDLCLDATRRLDALMNRLFADPLTGRGYPVADLPFIRRIEKYMHPGDEKALPFDFDFIGLQNYFRVVGRFSPVIPYLFANDVSARKLGNPLTAMNWEVYPQGVHDILVQFKHYNFKKLYVSENGMAAEDIVAEGKVHDTSRIAYFKGYLAEVLRARKAGVPVDGYFVWTLMDNFEWAEGYRPRFGLVYTDFVTQQRIVKDSGWWFRDFLRGQETL